MAPKLVNDTTRRKLFASHDIKHADLSVPRNSAVTTDQGQHQQSHQNRLGTDFATTFSYDPQAHSTSNISSSSFLKRKRPFSFQDGESATSFHEANAIVSAPSARDNHIQDSAIQIPEHKAHTVRTQRTPFHPRQIYQSEDHDLAQAPAPRLKSANQHPAQDKPERTTILEHERPVSSQYRLAVTSAKRQRLRCETHTITRIPVAKPDLDEEQWLDAMTQAEKICRYDTSSIASDILRALG